MANRRRGLEKEVIAAIVVVFLIFLGFTYVVYSDFLVKKANYAESCGRACEGFGFEFHSSEKNFDNKGDRCWCLKDSLPYEIPLK